MGDDIIHVVAATLGVNVVARLMEAVQKKPQARTLEVEVSDDTRAKELEQVSRFAEKREMQIRLRARRDEP